MAFERRWRIASKWKWDSVIAALRQFSIPFHEVPLELILREERVPPSDRQRALFHAVCEDVGPLLGYTPGEFKNEVKKIWFGDGWNRISTEDLSAEHYGQMIDIAYRTAAWAGIDLPDRRRR